MVNIRRINQVERLLFLPCPVTDEILAALDEIEGVVVSPFYPRAGRYEICYSIHPDYFVPLVDENVIFLISLYLNQHREVIGRNLF